MKKLTTADLFAAMRIVKAAEIKETLKPIIRKISEGKMTVSDIGIETVLAFIEGIADKKAESAFFAFLSSPFEMSEEDIAALPLAEMLDMLKKLAKENELKAFFGSLSSLIISK